MIYRDLDSRNSLGSDVNRRAPVPYPYVENSGNLGDSLVVKRIRVVLGRLGDLFRLSASELDIQVDAPTLEEAWTAFLNLVEAREDAAWLTFDVGPTRREEVERGLDAPEDEDWAEPADDTGGA